MAVPLGLGLKVLELWVSGNLSNTKQLNKNAISFVLWWNLLNKTEQNNDFALFPIQDPKARLRFEVLFKKIHPRIDLTTLYSTKSYLLNTIKPFSGHENRSLSKSRKPWQGAPAILNLAAILFFFFFFFLEIHPTYFSSIHVKNQFSRSTNTFAASPWPQFRHFAPPWGGGTHKNLNFKILSM
jgi:hypothetical protein